tara:strand:- start:64 stop:513 length:450 start_codon:yes stop_codon:yes gene_type:complete
MTQLFSFTEIVAQIAAEHWGKSFETAEQAKKSLMSNLDLQGACLLTLVKRVDSIVDAIAAVANKRALAAVKVAYETRIQEWLSEREPHHGKCPDDVLEWLENTLKRRIGHSILWGEIPNEVWCYPVPRDNPKVRKSYDRWMKRKAKAAE